MIIESIIHRPGGTKVTLDGILYEFNSANGIDAHICKVDDKEHIKQFLSVPEAFREYANQSATKTEDTADAGVNSGTDYEQMTKAELVAHIAGIDGDADESKLRRKSKKALIAIALKLEDKAAS